ncbi:MAG: TIGR03936 family radical SAM-associated protein, partial [Halothece sp. Uz-M2-17]|nr:TIGR03936 family radical SAM-associated protein [Halothece sp. Uz-M2-17]
LKGRKRLDFNVTISNFTPKPHTPFQWHSVSTSEFIRKQDLLRDEFRRMKGVKVNFTDVRISAMEDFVGRGDRRLVPVVRRAWELGAGMDAWWESLEKAYNAWETAIADAGLDWKYRQVENGEWDWETMASGTQNDRLDAPLPWDHMDTGIDKNWLKEDLKRALEAATVPDCSYAGCSHCGVCGIDFGHNIVVEPPEIPTFEGHFQPDQTREQRIRVRFSKEGKMRLVSHLDLVRLFDRAVRRAKLPISFTGGYHPGPRISIANALSLGMSSSGEIVDFDLKENYDLDAFEKQLSEQLPTGINIESVESVSLKNSATSLLEKAEYFVTVEAQTPVSESEWQAALQAVFNREEILWEKTTKSGKKKTLNLRDRAFEFSFVEQLDQCTAKLRYLGSCRNDGTLLNPEHFVYMLEQVTEMELQLNHAHREQLILQV